MKGLCNQLTQYYNTPFPPMTSTAFRETYLFIFPTSFAKVDYEIIEKIEKPFTIKGS